MLRRVLAGCLVLAAGAAHAQDGDAPLAQIRDEKQLADTLATITNDPAVHVTDDKARPVAAALMAEGVKQLQAQQYDQALANFLEAYARFPSPKILLNIASTLRDMGRIADAANTYQRYLSDPATGPERVAEVKQILVGLDTQLTLLTARVTPRGSQVSIDGGPFVTVGSALVTRVRPGIHLVRVRNGNATGEVTINGFEGETKDIAVTAAAPPSAPPAPAPLPTVRTPEEVNGWLVDGTRYTSEDGNSNERHARATFTGPEIRPVVPSLPEGVDDTDIVVTPPEGRKISSGVLGILRVDGKGRGAAGGLGLAVSPSDAIEIELAGLRSNVWGVYAGLRLRFLTGWVRPYAAAGVPVFFFENEYDNQNAVVFGARAAAGIEVRINGHVSVQGDLGYEHFFNTDMKLLDGKRPDANLFVPTIGVIGRL